MPLLTYPVLITLCSRIRIAEGFEPWLAALSHVRGLGCMHGSLGHGPLHVWSLTGQAAPSAGGGAAGKVQPNIHALVARGLHLVICACVASSTAEAVCGSARASQSSVENRCCVLLCRPLSRSRARFCGSLYEGAGMAAGLILQAPRKTVSGAGLIWGSWGSATSLWQRSCGLRAGSTGVIFVN